MRKFVIFSGITLIIFLLVLGKVGFLYPLNKIIPQNPDLSCKEDSDCTLVIYPEWVDCRICGSCGSFFINNSNVIAINSDWKPFCPFPHVWIDCPECIEGIIVNETTKIYGGYKSSFNYVKCIDGKCQKVVNSRIKEVPPELYCEKDEDCTYQQTACYNCGCPIPVNKDYVKSLDCPLQCPPPGSEDYDPNCTVKICTLECIPTIPKCVNNECKLIESKS